MAQISRPFQIAEYLPGAEVPDDEQALVELIGPSATRRVRNSFAPDGLAAQSK